MMKAFCVSALAIFFILVAACHCCAQESENNAKDSPLDARVKKFLSDHKGEWHHMNVPEVDGRLLYRLILNGHYTSALEIGTSTGYSAIWIAWALSKTGGKLITVEIDEQRHAQAVANFREAGLFDYIDARLADAHTLVRSLRGPFDFVFCDADKNWYKQYFMDISPRLLIGGCFAAHNVHGRGQAYQGTHAYYMYVKGLVNYETLVNDEGNGMSVSYKRAE